MSLILSAESRRNWLVALCILGLPISVRAQDEGELLALVKAGHRSAQESIRTLSCTVRYEKGFPTQQLDAEGKYWHSFDRARIQQETPTGTEDHYYLRRESELRSVTRNRPRTGQTEWGTRRELINHMPRELDVWRYMFLEFDLYLQSERTRRVKRERMDGRDCIRVTMPFKPGTESQITFWVDVGRNYLVWKRVVSAKEFRDEDEIVEFIEPRPGVFFPTKRVAKSFRGREQYLQGVITLSNVRINEPIAKAVFELPRVPRGTMCSDLIKKQEYAIDENWQQVPGSRAVPYDHYAISSGSTGQTGFTAQSTAEARSWTYWIAPASLAILALAGAAWLYRRYHTRSLETSGAGP